MIRQYVERSKEESGSALVLVMFMVLLLTILGVSVLSAALGGAQRTENRKNDVQSLHLAEKTLDEAVAYITSNLNKKVKNSGDLSPSDFDKQIKDYLSTLQTGLMASTNLSNASGKIIKVSHPDIHIDNNKIKYTLTLTAEASVNGVVRKLKKKVIIDTLPDFLRYTLGSEGDLIINGAPSIIGNIYAGDNLYISDTAKYIYKTCHTHVSNPFNLEGEAHVQSMDKLIYKTSVPVNGKYEFKASEITDATSFTGKIEQSKVKIRSHRKFVEVDVEKSFVDKVMEALGETDTQINTRNAIINSLKRGDLAAYLGPLNGLFDSIKASDIDKPVLGDNPTEADKKLFKQKMDTYLEKVPIIQKPTKSVIYKGSLTLDGSQDFPGILYSITDKDSTAIPRKWFIIDGDLIINNYGNPKAVQVRANVLVTGKVEIRGNVEIDSTMFVLKEPTDSTEEYTTLVEDATITGLNGKELVLISKGPILINRLAAFTNSTTEPLDAFFYTDYNADLYGVGSMLSLSGGFFAKGNLTINAVRGTVTEEEEGNDLKFIDNIEIIRFKTEYNNKILDDQKAGLPRVQSVNITVEDMQLE